MATKKGMKKSTYLILWSVIFALVLGAMGIANYEALKWDSAGHRRPDHRGRRGAAEE